MLLVEKLKSWALLALAVLAVILGAYGMGGRAARKSAEKKRNYDEALRAGAGAKGVHDVEVEIRRMPGGDAAGQLQRDWVRGNRATDANATGTRRDGT